MREILTLENNMQLLFSGAFIMFVGVIVGAIINNKRN